MNDEIITIGDRLDEIDQKIRTAIMSDKELIKLICSQSNDLKDILEDDLDNPSVFENKNIFFTVKDFNEAIQNSKCLIMEGIRVSGVSLSFIDVTFEFIILVHKDLQFLKNGKRRLFMIIRELSLLFLGKTGLGLGTTNLYTANTISDSPKDYVGFRVAFRVPEFKGTLGD